MIVRLQSHPHFFNQLSCGLDIISLAGEWLTAAANTNMFTYEIAPVFILMENVVLEKMRAIIGWSSGDSILAPGGSVSNLYAFLAARHHKFPQYKEKGLSSIPGQLVMFTSDQVIYICTSYINIIYINIIYIYTICICTIYIKIIYICIIYIYIICICTIYIYTISIYSIYVYTIYINTIYINTIYINTIYILIIYINTIYIFTIYIYTIYICNIYFCTNYFCTILVSCHHKFPQYKEKGLSSIPGQLVMFTSDQCHYSVKSCSSVCGLGTDFCICVPSDERGRMIPTELERLVRYHKDRGHVPFFVNATSGTTVLGAFDPLNEIADICQKYDMWMHVDAAWGGGLLFSKKYRHPRLSGVERADSVTWNPHKLMGTLLQCSTVHFKYEGILLNCNAMSAEYLFMTDKIYDPKYDTGDKVIQCGRHNDIFKLWLQWRGKKRTNKIYDPKYDTGDKVIQCGRHNKLWLQWRGKIYDPKYDTGDKVIQCGRHNDIFKLWLQWRGKGTNGFERHMDRLMELTEYMVRRIKEQPDKFYLIMEPECVNVSFWYLPTQLRNTPHDANKEILLGKVCAKLKGRMMQSGTIMVGYQPDDRRPNFFRNIISSAAVTEKDVDFLLAEFDRLGHDIVVN
ncbi:pyridoxal-dependent decarboxylase conserved domain-containing protein [Phthorimaea operculella]|nr:pyridoxal-dependent decarboxylase conserved domain-containing protein [Phthorimaea operculella]